MNKQLLISAVTFKLALALTLPALAHDGGHGPKVSDTGKYGGLVSAIVAKSEATKGAKAALLYKAELVRSAEGQVSVYIYDAEMKPVDIKKFAANGIAKVGAKVKGKWKNLDFNLTAKEKSFEGTMPKAPGKPYDIDVTIKENGKELLGAFDNLD